MPLDSTSLPKIRRVHKRQREIGVGEKYQSLFILLIQILDILTSLFKVVVFFWKLRTEFSAILRQLLYCNVYDVSFLLVLRLFDLALQSLRLAAWHENLAVKTLKRLMFFCIAYSMAILTLLSGNRE